MKFKRIKSSKIVILRKLFRFIKKTFFLLKKYVKILFPFHSESSNLKKKIFEKFRKGI